MAQTFGRSKTANKELPIGSRIAQQKWVDHCQDLHRYRLSTVSATIDNKWARDGSSGKRPTYTHLSSNSKKAQKEGDQQAERELENYILLAKLSKILQRKPMHEQLAPGQAAPSSTAVPPARALYSTQRYAELRRIHDDNLRIVQRIQAKRPIISTEQLERDYEQSRKYKEMISLFGEQRISRGSSVVPTPREHYTQPRSQRARPRSASSGRPAPPRSRPNSAGPTIGHRQRQLDASVYREAAHAHAGAPVWTEEGAEYDDDDDDDNDTRGATAGLTDDQAAGWSDDDA